MPIRAVIDGQDVIAPLLSVEEWTELKRRAPAGRGVVLPCCDARGFLRTSKLGTQHFVHKSRHDCTSAGETAEHLWAKAQVAAACRAAGWEASTELVGDGWRADVLARRADDRIAFEIQWSPQEETATGERQARYAASGIRSVWLLRSASRHRSDDALPVFAIEVGGTGNDPVVVRHGARRLTVSEAVSAYLSGRLHFATRADAQLRVVFVPMDCWKCGAAAHFYYGRYRVLCSSIAAEDADEDGFEYGWTHFSDEVRESAEALRREHPELHVGAVKARFSRTLNQSYLSFGCPRCDAIFGEFFIRRAMLDAIYDEAYLPHSEVDLVIERRHWCFGTCGGGDPVAQVA